MSAPRLILGVDPGHSGALALLDPIAPRKILDVWDMPMTEGLAGKPTVDAAGLALLIDSHAKDIAFAVLEDVGAMIYMAKDQYGELSRRGQGAAASFAFGKSAGIIQGVLSASYIQTHPVKPSVWKILMGLNASKETSRTRATALFPNDSHRWARKKDDGRAEAVLLAVFGAERFSRA